MKRFLSCVLLLLCAAVPAAAQPYPAKPVRLVVPYPPGGITDTLGRIVGQSLGEALGKPIVIDNRPGANGGIGTDNAVASPADGYTLLLGALTTQVLNPLLRKVSYDPVKDLEPVGMVAETPLFLVINPALPARTLTPLLEWLKANPDKANSGTYGEASLSHLAAALLSQATGVSITAVHYKGSAPAATDVVSGEIGMAIVDASSVPLIRAGKLVPVAMTGARRSATLPDVPTIAEAGIPGYEATGWFAIYMRSGTPPAILDQVASELGRITSADWFHKRLIEIGLEPTATPRAEVTQRTLAERDKWERTIARAGIKVVE